MNKEAIVSFLEEGIKRYDEQAELMKSVGGPDAYFMGKASAYHDVLLLLKEFDADHRQALRVYCAGLYGYAYQEGFNHEPKDFDTFWNENHLPNSEQNPE